MHDIDASIMVLKGNNKWNKADKSALEMLESVLREKPMVVLNEAEDYAVEELISGVKTKKTSPFQKSFKKVIEFPSRIKVVPAKEN
jgi:GTPase Era involved in 16S rRNA processing